MLRQEAAESSCPFTGSNTGMHYSLGGLDAKELHANRLTRFTGRLFFPAFAIRLRKSKDCMVGTGRFELPIGRIPGGLASFSSVCRSIP